MAQLIDQLKNGKVALVLSGGGARGAYQIGIWGALRDLEISFEIVTGISVGALNSVFVVLDLYEDAKQMWESIQTSDILDYQIENDLDTLSGYIKNVSSQFYTAFKKKGIDTTPLKEIIDYYLPDQETLDSIDIEYGVVVTNTETNKEESYFLNNRSRKEIKELILASASLYPIMEKTLIGDVPYADGGYRDNVPIPLAKEKNPGFIIANELMPVSNTDYDNDKKVIMVKHKWYLGDMMTFDAARNKRNIRLGYNDLMKALDVYYGHLYTFTDFGTSLREDLLNVLYKDFSNNLLTDILYILKSNQEFLIKKLSKEWDKQVNEENFHIAILEITARLFFVEPYDVHSVDSFIELLRLRLTRFYNSDKDDLLNQFMPEYSLGRKEWRRLSSVKLSLLPEQERIFNYLDQFNKKNDQKSNVSNRIMFKIDPIPFTVALLIYAFMTNENNLTHKQ